MQNLGDQILCLGAWWRWFSPKLCLTLAAPWTVACQPPLSMGFYRQEYWSGLTFPSPGNLPDPGIKPGSPALQADSLSSDPPGKPDIFNKGAFKKKYVFQSSGGMHTK